MVLEKTLEIPWTARRSNQSNLKEISPGCSLEGRMLKLKLQSFGHLIRRAHSLEKTLMPGKIEGRRRRGQQRVRWLDGITNLIANAVKSWETRRPGLLQFMVLPRVRQDLGIEQQQSFTRKPLSWDLARQWGPWIPRSASFCQGVHCTLQGRQGHLQSDTS